MTGLYPHGLMVEELFAPQMRCSYPSKVCLNPRAVKLCGSLHKLCEFHRKKANTNQKRLQQRRRVIRSQMSVRVSNDVAFYDSFATTTSAGNHGKDSTNDDVFSAFETSFLDSLIFGELPTIGLFNDCTIDQEPLRFDALHFELQL